MSKSAVKLAAKKHQDITFIVANTYSQIPIRSGSVTLLMSIFAPRHLEEFKRLIHKAGAVLMVIPGEEHLSEVIKPLGLMKIEPDKEIKIKTAFQESFLLHSEQSLDYKISLTTDEIVGLIKMGPNYWKINSSIDQKVKDLNIEKVTVSMKILLWKFQTS